MTTIFDAIDERDTPKVRQWLDKYPEDVNARDSDKNTPLMLAIVSKDDALIDVCLGISCLEWNARNTDNATILLKAIQIGNTTLVRRLLDEPKFSHTLQNYTNTEKCSLLACAILENREAIIQLLCNQFPNILSLRNENDRTPLHSLGALKVDDSSDRILKDLLNKPGIERSLETPNLNTVLFNVHRKLSYSPLVSVILHHYLHHSTPEHDEANKHHLEKYIVQVFRAYDENNLSDERTDIFDVTAEILFYYQKKFTHLDNLYTQLASNSTPDRFHFFIRCLKIVNLKKLIWEHETYQLIQARFNLSNFNQDIHVVMLAKAIWYQWSCKTIEWENHPKKKMLLLWKIANVATETDNQRGSIQALPRELKDMILGYLSEEMIAPTTDSLLVPHTPDQQHKAFALLLKGLTSWHTSPFIFTSKRVDDKITLTRTSVANLKEAKEAIEPEAQTIQAYLQEETARQLRLFDVPTP